MGREARGIVEATRLQRAVITVAAGALLVLCLATVQTAHHLSPRALDVAGRGGQDLPSLTLDIFVFAACAETLIAFAGFCFLTIVWGIFQPAWAGRSFNFLGKHVWHVLIVFILGFLGVSVLFAVIAPR